MADLPHPGYIVRRWIIGESGNTVRAELSKRYFPDGSLINQYTGLSELVGGSWRHVKGVSDGHGDDHVAAEARIRWFLDGGWTNHVVRDVMLS